MAIISPEQSGSFSYRYKDKHFFKQRVIITCYISELIIDKMDSKEKNIDTYPGDARSAGDKKATPCEVKEDVKELNNNPRNSDDEMP